jgi:NAD(P)-dependent dehydrogenase (short-subunit alcohol dehydrogenase family)
MNKVVIVTGASSGFGRLSANAVARSGHTVYASMRETSGRNAPQVAELQKFAKNNNIDLRAIELDVQSQESVDRAVTKIISAHGHIDVVVHNAGHMDFGPAILQTRLGLLSTTPARMPTMQTRSWRRSRRSYRPMPMPPRSEMRSPRSSTCHSASVPFAPTSIPRMMALRCPSP